MAVIELYGERFGYRPSDPMGIIAGTTKGEFQFSGMPDWKKFEEGAKTDSKKRHIGHLERVLHAARESLRKQEPIHYWPCGGFPTYVADGPKIPDEFFEKHRPALENYIHFASRIVNRFKEQ